MSHDWGYHGSHGPANWADTYPQCGGTRQSPIDIDTNSVNRRYDLASLDTSSYDERFDEDQATAVLSNTGHSVQVTMKYNDRPVYSLRDGELESTYHLEQFHFHWGSNNHEGAEHTVNGRSYPMEVHFVHYRSDLDNVATAKTQEGGLVVLGALFKIGDHNENYEDIVENLSNIRYSGQTAPLRRFRPSSLLPRSLSRFYRYHGSLTTPTCDENVTWLVLHEPIYISEEQLEQFRRLYSTEEGGSDEPLSNNFRPTQPLNDRNILASFGDD